MKEARQRARQLKTQKTGSQPSLRPRNVLATHPLLKKGAVHLRTDKRASRARQKAQQKRAQQ